MGVLYLDENRVTIKSKDEGVVGKSYELNGEKFQLVNEAILRKMVENKDDVTMVVTSKVTDMSNMFSGAKRFNRDIRSWDVSSVTNMSNMFNGAKRFNGAIGDWDVSSVTNMSNMFNGAKKFNGDIGDWDVSNVTDMSYMFGWAKNFNQDIGDWDVSNVTKCAGFFFHSSYRRRPKFTECDPTRF